MRSAARQRICPRLEISYARPKFFIATTNVSAMNVYGNVLR